MSVVDGVLVNGKQWDWGNISLIMFNGLITMVSKISFGEKMDSVNNYGIGQFPIGYGNKNFTYSGSIEMYQDEKSQIAAAAPAGKLLLIPPFSIKIILAGVDVQSKTIKLMNCRFTDNSFDAKQNDSSLMISMPFTFAGMIENLT